MSEYTVRNLLKGTSDGSWAATNWWRESTNAFGTNVISQTAKGYQVDNSNVTTIGPVPRKGDSVTLGFWCKASAKCQITSHLFSDGNSGNTPKHNENGVKNGDGYVNASVGTDWTYVRHTWTYDEDAAKSPMVIVARIQNTVPVGTVVSVAGVMVVDGDTPDAWAPAEGETLAGGGCSHER